MIEEEIELSEDEANICIDCLKEFKIQLNNNNASALVGAGFSKNANPKYPSWDELLTGIIDELYKDEITEYTKNREEFPYKKVIKEYGYLDIVEKYINNQGYRESIDTYIETKFIPIENDINSYNLHIEFLKLPWKDIYTTNYDTLLEKSNEKMRGRYKICLNSFHLHGNSQKNIIKLHGTIRNQTEIDEKKYGFDNNLKQQYIISKNDFDNYEKEHNGFFNIVKTAIFREYFLLIGFSGEDPNFQSWIDWVNNILERNKKTDKGSNNKYKILLLEVNKTKISQSKKQYYHNLGICWIPLNNNILLNNISGNNKGKYNFENTYGRIKCLIDYLDNKDKDDKDESNIFSNLWSEIFAMSINRKIDENKVKEIFTTMNIDYKDFILPKENIINNNIKEFLLYYGKNKIAEIINSNNQNEFLDFLYIFNRTVSLSFYPIESILAELYQATIDFFKGIIFSEIKDSQQKENWFNFTCLIIKNARLLLNDKVFFEWKELIINKNPPKDILNRIFYEEGLLYSYNLETEKLKTLLDKWAISENDGVLWGIKKVNLLMMVKEQKYYDEAIEILGFFKNKTIDNKQIRIWYYEMLIYYGEFQIIGNENYWLERDYYRREIKKLEKEGFYTIKSVLEYFIPKEKKEEIKPIGEGINKITRSQTVGDEKNSENFKSIQFIEILNEMGVHINFGFSFIDFGEWKKVYNNIIDTFFQHIYFFSFQYFNNRIPDNKNFKRAIQDIIYNKNISLENKIDLYEKIKSQFYYYFKSKNYNFILFIEALSEFVKVIDYPDWEKEIKLLLNYKEDNFNNYLVTDLRNQYNNILKFVSNKKLLKSLISEHLLLESGKSYIDNSDYIWTILFKNIFILKNENEVSSLIDKSNVNDLLKSNDLNTNYLTKLYYIFKWLSDEQKSRIVCILKDKDLSKIPDNLWRVIIVLSNNDFDLKEKIKIIIMGKQWFINLTNGRIGGDYINLSSIKKTDDFPEGLEFSKDELSIILEDFKKTWEKVKQLKSKKDSYFFMGNELNQTEKILYNFLEEIKDIFTDNKDFNDYYNGIIGEFSKYTVNDKNIFSDDPEDIFKYLKYFSKEINNNLNKDQSEKWLSIIFKILYKNEPKIEESLDFISGYISDRLKNEDWVKKHTDYYIKILESYYYNPPKDTDTIYIEVRLVNIAIVLKEWGKNHEIINKWLDYKNISQFLEIKQI